MTTRLYDPTTTGSVVRGILIVTMAVIVVGFLALVRATMGAKTDHVTARVDNQTGRGPGRSRAWGPAYLPRGPRHRCPLDLCRRLRRPGGLPRGLGKDRAGRPQLDDHDPRRCLRCP
jgi:hypothetical protein